MMLTGFHSPSAPRRAGYRARNTTREEPSLACAVVPQSFRTYMSTCHVGQSINLIGRLDLRWNDLTKKTNLGDRIWKIVCIFEWLCGAQTNHLMVSSSLAEFGIRHAPVCVVAPS